MNPSKDPDVVITPAKWQQHAAHLSQTSTGLLNLVGWYGSTHKAAMWRKAGGFLDVFQQKAVTGFDPQVEGDWQASYALIEAEVMATASVLTIRLENNELLNGSLGSIAEVGLALTSAALRGQIVIVSIEENLLASLDEPGAIAQYIMLEMYLDQFQKVDDLAPFLRIHRGDDLQALAKMACETAHQQAHACRQPLNFEIFMSKKARRSQNYPLQILTGGSGGPYAGLYASAFQSKKELLTEPYLAAGHTLKTLNEGTLAEAWAIAYGSPDPHSAAVAMQALLTIEYGLKQEADVLLLPIMAEAASKAAATEAGFLLLQALITGQDIKIFLEPFNPVDYMRYHLTPANLDGCEEERQARSLLKQAGVAHSTLAMAVQPEIAEACRFLDSLGAGDGPTFKEIKSSLLGRTTAFRDADNIRRVRFLVQAHLKKLSSDERFPGLFSYSEQIA